MAYDQRNSGLTFPLMPQQRQTFKRSDLNAYFYYDGTNWQPCDPPIPPTDDEAYIYRDGWMKLEELRVGEKVYIDKTADPHYAHPYKDSNTGVITERQGDRYQVQYDIKNMVRFNFKLWFDRRELERREEPESE